MYQTFDDVVKSMVEKFNPYHDKNGRFCSANSASFMTITTKDPSKQHMADRAVERARQQYEDSKPKEVKLSDIENGDWDAMDNYVSKSIGATIDKSVKYFIDFESVRETVQGIEWVQNEFPKSKGTLKKLKVESIGIMNTSFDGAIGYSTKHCSFVDTLRKDMSDGAKTHWHPSNSTSSGCGAHEYGHILELALIEKNYPVSVDNYYYDTQDKMNAWNKSKEASRIISVATKAAKKTEAGKGKIQSDLRREISGYAMKSKSETLAEAIADCYDNGDNAATLSKEIFKALKAELG